VPDVRLQKMSEQPTAEDLASQAQQELLESCLDLVFETQAAAVADKLVDPVILLLDCEDKIGAQIATAWLGAEALRDAIAEQRFEDPAGEETTVYARAFAWAECRREVPTVFDYLAPVFDEPIPTEGFLAIAVTAGGASVFTVPASAREPEN